MSTQRTWHFPLEELPTPIALPLLFGVPAIAGAVVQLNASISELVLPYVIVLGTFSGVLEVQRSKKIRLGGAGDVGLAVVRNISHTGFFVVASMIVGFIGATTVYNFRLGRWR